MIDQESNFPQVMKKYRQLRGVTYRELSRRTTIASGALVNYETGTREPTFRAVRYICHALGIPQDEVWQQVPKTLDNLSSVE